MLAGGRMLSAADVFMQDAGIARARGSVMHRWLAEVEWLDDFDPEARRADLLSIGGRLARELGIDPSLVPGWWETLVRWLEQPVTRAQLERAACPLAESSEDVLVVWRERRFDRARV